MFVNTDEVNSITGISVNPVKVQMAQYIIEMYTGRSEARVVESDDLYALRLATAYQAAYMEENAQTVFSQVGVSDIQQERFRMRMASETDPYIAPLAKMACSRLSWFRARSISTAPYFHKQREVRGWRYD